MMKVTTAITAANGIVQRKSGRSGRARSGRFNGLNEMSPVLSPVNDPMPSETSDPIPAARRPGIRISGTAVASPAASSRITAAMIGEPNRNAIAAKVPELARSVPSCGGALGGST